MTHPNQADLADTGFLHRFLQISAARPDAIAIHSIDDGTRISFGELRAEADAINGALSSLDAAPGDRLLLLLPNGVPLVALYLAAIGRGCIPVMVNDKLTPCELAALIQDAAPRFVATSAALLEKHAAALAALPALRSVLLVGDAPRQAANLPPALSARLAPLSAIDSPPQALRAPEGNPVVTIQYTYKGLGRPLPVAHRYLALTRSSDGLDQEFHPQGIGSVHLVALPLYAVFGLTVLMVYPLSIGATMLMTNAIARHDIADLLAQHRVSFACLVPDLLRLLIVQLGKRQAPLPELDPKLMLYSGGAYLSPDVAAEAGRLLGRPPVLQGYGLTECLPVVLQSSLQETRAGAIGKPISCAEVRIIDDAGAEVEDGRVGELIVGGPTVAAGYLDRAEASAAFFRNGWLHTGDLVRRDADGSLFFVGRRLRITKVRALMVDLAELEQAAAIHPGVQRARAHVVRDEQGRNAVHLCVTAGAGTTADAVLEHLTARLSAFKLPRSIDVLPAGAAANQDGGVVAAARAA